MSDDAQQRLNESRSGMIQMFGRDIYVPDGRPPAQSAALRLATELTAIAATRPDIADTLLEAAGELRDLEDHLDNLLADQRFGD